MSGEDVAELATVDGDALVACLEERFLRHEPYTMCRHVCLSINPYRWRHDLYDDEHKSRYRRVAPERAAHVYQVAKRALDALGEDEQTVVITGESGAGKTEVARLCLDFVADDLVDRERIGRTIHAQPILEYMGNAQTTRNRNSSRFGKLISLLFDGPRQVGTTIDTYLLERVRAVGFGEGEGTFRIMHAILNDEGVRNEYALMGVDQALLGVPRDDSPLESFAAAAQSVGIDPRPIVRGAVAVLYLRLRDYANAAKVLELSPTDLTHAIGHRRTVVQAETIWSECEAEEQRRRVSSLVMALYDRRFRETVRQINARLHETHATTSALRVLDIFGFERLATNGLEQLCINYCNERMQTLFVDDIIVMQQLEFANEGMTVPHVAYDTNVRVVELYDNTIFPLLEEARRLSQTPDGFVEAVNRKRPAGFAVPLVRQTGVIFSIDHYAGPVCYDAERFNERNADELRPEIVELMRGSVEAELFCDAAGPAARSVTIEFQRQMRGLTSTIRAAHYVRCIRPNEKQIEGVFDRGVVREQLVSNGIVHACQVMRHAYPIRMTHAQFRARFRRVRPPSTLASDQLFWGKTVVYMAASVADGLERDAATRTLRRAACAWARRRRGALRIQHAARQRLARRAEAKRHASVVSLQRAARRRLHRSAEAYRMLDELGRLKEQVRRLREEVRAKDAWIFRATSFLRQYVRTDRAASLLQSVGV